MTVNDEVLAYVVDKVRTHFSEDVDLVIAYGSHVTGNAGPNSDVDVCLVVNNDLGYQAVENFIINGVGYDVWAMDWKRLRRIAKLKEHLASIIGLGEVAWARDCDQHRAFDVLREDMHKRLADLAYTHKRITDRILDAEDLLSRVWEKGDIGVAREGLAFIVMALGEAVAFENGTYIKHGIKNWKQEMENLQLVPRELMERLDHVMKSNDEEEILEHGRMAIYHLQKAMRVPGIASFVMDNNVTDVHWPSNLAMAFMTEEEREESFGYATETSRKVNANLDYQRAAWWHEEAESTFNKIYAAVENEDHVTAFFAAAQLQHSMRNDCEAAWPTTDFLGAWDYNNLEKLRARTRSIEQEAVAHIEGKGVPIRHVANPEALYAGNPVRDWSALSDHRAD